jgi:hypothetical protein
MKLDSRARTLLLRLVLISLACAAWLARIALEGTTILLIAIGITVLVVLTVYLEVFRYVGRQNRHAHALDTERERRDHSTELTAAEPLHIFASLSLVGYGTLTHDFPDLQLRRTIFSLIQGKRAGGRLDIETDGLHFRTRRWPISIGVRGKFFIPWSAIKEVQVTQPKPGVASSLGGKIILYIPSFKRRVVSLEFFGSKSAVISGLSRAGAPLLN